METLTGLEQLFDTEHMVMLDDEDIGMMDDLEAELLNDGMETPLTTLAAFDEENAALLEPRQVKRSLYNSTSTRATAGSSLSKNPLEMISLLQAQLRAKDEELLRLRNTSTPNSAPTPSTDGLSDMEATVMMDQDWIKMEAVLDLEAGSLSGGESFADENDFAREFKECEEEEENKLSMFAKNLEITKELFASSHINSTSTSKNTSRTPMLFVNKSTSASSISPSGDNKRSLTALDLATPSTSVSGASVTSLPQKKRVKGLLGRKMMSEPAMSTTELINSDITPETAGGDAANRGKKYARRWTTAQDEELRIAVAKNNGQNWKAIARMVTERDHVQCLQRWKKVLQPGLVKGMWSKEEDDLLLDLMSSSQPKNWADIAAKVPGRTAKQCRERWSLNLDPSINRQAWSQEEDELLLKLHDKLGNRWAEIKRHLNGRTENGVKTRFKSIERARAKDKEVIWTSELEAQLHEIAVRFECRIDEVAKHLPRALRGISSQAMRTHCEILRDAENNSSDVSFV